MICMNAAKYLLAYGDLERRLRSVWHQRPSERHKALLLARRRAEAGAARMNDKIDWLY